MLTQTPLSTLELTAWPSLADYDFRALRREDLPALYELLLCIEQAEERRVVGTLEDLQHEYDDPWSLAETDSLTAWTNEGQLVGYARTFQNPQLEDEARCHLLVEIHPSQRSGGLESALLNWVEERGQQRLQSAAVLGLQLLCCGIQDTQLQRQAWLEQHAYNRVRYFYRMQRALSDPIPAVQLPGDLALQVYTPDLSQAVQAAFNEAFRDHWSFEPATTEDWQKFFIERTSFRPDLTYVVMADQEVAGLSFNCVGAEENARRQTSEGWIDILAVRRPWRKRGVATALLCASLHAFKAEGLQHAMLGVDTQNSTGALRVYERVGFQPVKRFIQFRKAVA